MQSNKRRQNQKHTSMTSPLHLKQTYTRKARLHGRNSKSPVAVGSPQHTKPAIFSFKHTKTTQIGTILPSGMFTPIDYQVIKPSVGLKPRFVMSNQQVQRMINNYSGDNTDANSV